MAFISTKKSFLKAAASGDIDEVRDCLANKYDINTSDKDGVTVLSLAACNGHLKVLRLLLERGPDLEAADKDGRTALLGAVNNSRTEAAKILIAAGAQVNAHTNGYVYPLQAAAWGGDLDIVQALVDAKADINTVIRANGRTALHWAVDKEFGPIVEVLMKAGARTDIANTEGKTALDLAQGKTSPRILNIMESLKSARLAAAAPTAKTPAAASSAAGAADDTWALLGASSIAHAAVAPALGRKLTTIFNFEARERVLITENLKTGAETMGSPEKFETLTGDTVQRAEEMFKTLGGTLAAKMRLNL